MLEIFKNLEPDDILNQIKASELVKETYHYINNSPAYKFIFDSRIEPTIQSAMLSQNIIKHVHIDINDMDVSQYSDNIWTLLNRQTNIQTLRYIDQPFFPVRVPPVALRHKLEFLTRIEVYASHTESEIHSISPILRVAPNVKELTYTNGNLDKYGLKTIKNLEKLILNNVNIESMNEFTKLLQRSKDTLKILHFDYSTCCILMSNINTIKHLYDNLLTLRELKELTIPAGNSLCRHHNLESPPKLEKLKIHMSQNSYLYTLFVILKRIIVTEMTIEFRQCIHTIAPVPELIEKNKEKIYRANPSTPN